MVNLTRLSVLVGETDADRRRQIAELARGLGVGNVVQVDAPNALLLALKTQAFDVLICAQQLGAEDSVEVLRAARKLAPATRFVLMLEAHRTGQHVPEGVETIERTLSRQSLQGLLQRTAAPHGGLWCEVAELSLTDILQMYHQARRSITVLLSGPIAGVIRLQEGEIVDAEANDEHGLPALSRLFEADTGLVRTEALNADAPRRISAPFQSVILEAAHKLDERRRDRKNQSVSPVGEVTGVSPGGLASGLSAGVAASPGSRASLPSPSFGGHAFLPAHDFIGSERTSVSSAVPGPANSSTLQPSTLQPPMVPSLAPNTTSFIAPSPRARSRSGRVALISMLASLLFVGVTALYFKDRLELRAREFTAGPQGVAEQAQASDKPLQPAPAPTARPAPAVEPLPMDDPHTGGSGPQLTAKPLPTARPLPTAEPLPNHAKLPEPTRGRAPSFDLHITSKPNRATVLEAGRVLGKTPLTVKIDSSSVADSAREFVLRLPGYFPARIRQAASDASVSSSVVLYPRAVVVAEVPDAGMPEYDPESARPGNPRAARRKDLDIRLRR